MQRVIDLLFAAGYLEFEYLNPGLQTRKEFRNGIERAKVGQRMTVFYKVVRSGKVTTAPMTGFKTEKEFDAIAKFVRSISE